MKYKILILFLIVFIACRNFESKQNKIDFFSNNFFLKETSDSSKSTLQILHNFLPNVLALAKVDTCNFYYGDFVIEDDSIFRQILIGKFIDKETIIATEINIKDTTITFYYLDNGNWKIIGSEKTNIPIYQIDFEDLDGDTNNEIIISTGTNMNGNKWQEVYYYSKKVNTIKYAGSFSTDYTIKKEKKQIEQTYTGSWYMDNSKTLYEWRDEKLVPRKQIVIVHEQPISENGKFTLEFYENKSNNLDGLTLKFKEPFNNVSLRPRPCCLS
jgi:hypothetical protein